MVLRDLELGAIRVHILHHAAEAPFFGSWMVDELARHGYTLRACQRVTAAISPQFHAYAQEKHDYFIF